MALTDTEELRLAVLRGAFGEDYQKHLASLKDAAEPQNHLDREMLEQSWDEARSRLTAALSSANLAPDVLLYHPHLAALEAFIRNDWGHLRENVVFSQALEFIDRMDRQPVAAVMGYQELLLALSLAGDTELLAVVADLQKQYMETNDFWRTFRARVERESHPNVRPADFTGTIEDYSVGSGPNDVPADPS